MLIHKSQKFQKVMPLEVQKTIHHAEIDEGIEEIPEKVDTEEDQVAIAIKAIEEVEIDNNIN